MSEATTYLVVRLNKSYFALAVAQVIGLIVKADFKRIQPPVTSPVVRGILDVRGELYTDINFAKLVGLFQPSSEREFGLLTKTTVGNVCLDVDQALDVVVLSADSVLPVPISGALRNSLTGVFNFDEKTSGFCLDLEKLLAEHAKARHSG